MLQLHGVSLGNSSEILKMSFYEHPYLWHEYSLFISLVIDYYASLHVSHEVHTLFRVTVFPNELSSGPFSESFPF